MTTAMKAAFTLTLVDKLSSGLNAIKKGFDDLRNKGNELGLGKLERGGDFLRTVGRAARDLTSDLRGVEAAAGRGWKALKQMASVKWQNNFGSKGRFTEPAAIIGGAIAGYSIVKPIRDFARFDSGLRHDSTTSGLYGAANDAERARLNKMFGADALATGQSSEKIQDAYYEILSGGVARSLLDQVIGAHSRFATAYRVDPKEAGQLSIALLKNMELTPPQYEAALGQAGQISKEGLFKVAGFSQYMPMISGQMHTMGMTGPDATLQALSALQIVRRSTGDDGMAATDLRTLLEHIYAPMQERSMRMHGRQVPDDLRQMVQENAGAWKKAFGIDYSGYMRQQEKAGVNPLDAYVGLMRQLTKAPDFTDKMRIFGQLSHSQQAGSAVQALLANYGDWMKMRSDGAATGSEVFERDFGENMRGAAAAAAHLDETLAQLDRRVGEGFAPVLTPINTALDLVLAASNKLDQLVPGFGNAVLAVTGSMLALGAALAAMGFVAPAVAAGGALLGTGLAIAGGALASPFVGIPAMAVGIPALAKLGSDYETPETQAARDQLDREQRSQEGGPNGSTYDGFGPDGMPITSSSAPQKDTLHIQVSTAPGTAATVLESTRPVSVDRGPTTGQP